MKNILAKLLAVVVVVATFTSCHFGKSEVKEINYSLLPYVFKTDEGAMWLGYLDTKGNVVINPRFPDAWAFSCGLAQVVDTNYLHGYIDETGRFVIPAIYDNETMFFENLAFAHQPGQPIVCLNTEGKVVFELPDIIEAGVFSEGLAPVCNSNNKWGFVNNKGEMVITPQFDQVDLFSEGLAGVMLGNKCGYIGHDGHFVINPQYRTVYTFTFGKAHVKKSNYGYGDIIDKQGVDVSDKFSGCDYDWISEGLVLGTEKQHTIIRNHYGDLMATTQKFDNWGRFSEGLCKVLIGKKWGFIDKKGLVAINPLYDNVSNFHDGVAIVVVDDKYGLIDHKGNVVVEPQYLHIGSIPHFWAGSSETMLKSDMLPKYSCRLDINRTKKKKK